MNLRRTLLAALAMSLGCLSLSPALAQDKPPLKILVGFPPGGSADVLARLIGDAIKDDFASVVVDNKPGAGGRLALTLTRQAKADGQTVVILPSGPMVLFPHVYKKLEYDAVKDFTPVSQIARFQFGVVAGPASPAKNVAEMVARAKADPKTATYGTPGQGTLPHFMGVLLEQSTGAAFTHVPFQGGAPANTALLGGHIESLMSAFPSLSGAATSNQVKLLAANSLQRSSQAPDLPAISEIIPGFDFAPLVGFYGRTGIPAPVLEKIGSEVIADPRWM